jgi:SAM-dependent methyltransferase
VTSVSPTADTPSPWLVRWAHLIPAGGHVLDVAAGGGRHTRWLAERGHAVTAIDRDAAAMAALGAVARAIVADIEKGPWPLPGHRFDAVVVTNYLWRPILADIVGALAPGGVLVYETFAVGNETVGRPSNPQFLLRPGELLEVAATLRIVAYEHGFLDAPRRFVQRVVAVRDSVGEPGVAARHPLPG